MENTGVTLFGRPVAWKDVIVALIVAWAVVTFFTAVRTGDGSLRTTLLYQSLSGSDGTQQISTETSNIPPGETPSNIDITAPVEGCPAMGKRRDRPSDYDCAFDGALAPLGSRDEGPWVALMLPPPGRSQVDAHASNIIELPSGVFLLAWFSGSEGDDGVAIVVSRMEVGAKKWSEPIVVSAQEGRSAQNPILFHDKHATYLLHTSQAAFLGQGTAEVRWLQSTDGGITWTEPVTLFTEPGAFVRNQMLLTSAGEWLLPMYYTPNGFGDFATHYSVMKSSADQGATWQEAKMTEMGDWLAQPTVTWLKDGTLFGLHRDRQAKYLYSTTSTDEGRTWSKAKATKLPNNNSGIQVTTTTAGQLVLVFNNLQGGPRTPLSVALSEDGGVTWPYVRDLDVQSPGDFSYPSIIQGSDGLLHITYTYHRETIKYVRVSVEWVKGGTSTGEFKGGAA
mmetsp:Transcript_14993/g.25388  ORF Transcript_14993/g.25388 Transcript_14993/m.25388 type:complete len:450 (+) Transcript_14993:226-1575(+)|eukprot:CAMPEP_0198205656 /NCGR_PEP_ID=MMETSP1445-20131203/9191_1 /TAXON_ID=36898 /ORGANISM="Pyramimonas sp., Strain CCMP2087" /LENGTH=449 /DNA_ID=CAMNT_0043878035 /DNA_START=192 /DNA_END=1541 /DNA_ORIENTATION=+